jgi:integrase
MSLTLHARQPKPATTGPAARTPVDPPALGQFLAHWLDDVVKPLREPAGYTYYEAMVRLYIAPALGGVRLDQLRIGDVQAWLDELPMLCQCCVQGKDAARPPRRRRCCAAGTCCHRSTGQRTIQAARNTLLAALNHAVKSEQLITANPARFARLPDRPGQQPATASWCPDEATRFLASAREDNDPLYAGYVLVIVNALSRGEVLGLRWPGVDFDGGALDASWQLQRVGKNLIHKQRPATASSAGFTIPLPHACAAALKHRRDEQETARHQAAGRWQDSDLVFTTRWGTPVEPRNFNRSFTARCAKAGVPRIRVRDARQVSPAILADLDAHPDAITQILRHAKITGDPPRRPGDNPSHRDPSKEARP